MILSATANFFLSPQRHPPAYLKKMKWKRENASRFPNIPITFPSGFVTAFQEIYTPGTRRRKSPAVHRTILYLDQEKRFPSITQNSNVPGPGEEIPQYYTEQHCTWTRGKDSPVLHKTAMYLDQEKRESPGLWTGLSGWASRAFKSWVTISCRKNSGTA